MKILGITSFSLTFAITLFLGANVYAGAIDPGWPDAIVCDTQAQDGNITVATLFNDGGGSLYQYNGGDGARRVVFDNTGGIVANDYLAGPCMSYTSLTDFINGTTTRDFGYSTTTSTTTLITTGGTVDNPTLDYFLGIMVMFITMFFVVWLFKKK